MRAARAITAMVQWSAMVIPLLFCAPVLAGLFATVQLAFATSVDPALLQHPWQDSRFWPALRITLFSGIGSTLLVFGLAVLTLVSVHGSPAWQRLRLSLLPLLAVPHAAMAVALLFLLAPSGWLMRLLAVVVPMERPPLAYSLPDTMGLFLLLGLVVKETPFLIFVAMAQLERLEVAAVLRIGRSLGYSRVQCWTRLLLPQLLPRLGLMLLVILAFNLAVVDMALVLGPDRPPTLAVLLLQWWQTGAERHLAAQGALLLMLLTMLIAAAGVVLLRLLRPHWHRGCVDGERREVSRWRLRLAARVSRLWAGMALLSLMLLVVWSFSRRWRWPSVWPQQLTLQHWVAQSDRLFDAAITTLGLGVLTALLAVSAAIMLLELERVRHWPRLDALWFLPLLLPQPLLFFGWQLIALPYETVPRELWVLHAHWLFALPYTVLVLAVPWRAEDPQWRRTAALLGAGYVRQLWQLRLPLLRRTLAQALAVAMAVSVAQYLSSLLLGGGRVSTLTLELLASQSGSDLGVMAAFALLQAVLPMVFFALALGVREGGASA